MLRPNWPAPMPGSQPLVTHMYTADPRAHVFEGRIYVYPSHDIEAGIPFNDNGDHFAMEDYHVFSMDRPDGEVTDHSQQTEIITMPRARRVSTGITHAALEGTATLEVYQPPKAPSSGSKPSSSSSSGSSKPSGSSGSTAGYTNAAGVSSAGSTGRWLTPGLPGRRRSGPR